LIIVKLYGGLGNQLFQYAFGRNLALKNNCDLKFDTSFYANQNLRKIELYPFNFDFSIASSDEIKKIRLEKNFFTECFRKSKTIVSSYYKRRIIDERSFDFDPNYLKIKDPSYLNGYWQSEKYFKEIRNILIQELIYKPKLSETFNTWIKQIKESNSVSVHIRRGDYVNNNRTNALHGLCPIEYYEESIQIIIQKINHAKLFVFSDDMDWCQKHLAIYTDIHFVNDTQNHFEDMYLMSLCKHNIIANSSFSWWGAWLNSNENKIVIAPHKWFDQKKSDTKSLIPESWIQI